MLNEKDLARLLERGTITVGYVTQPMEALMKTIIEKVHKHKITKLKDGRYSTWVPDETKKEGRRQVRRASMKDLEDYLVEFYGVVPGTETATFGKAFKEWVEYKRGFINASYKPLKPSTIRKYERDYKRFIKGTDLESARIDVDSFTLKNMLISIIKENSMTPEAFGNVFGYVQGVFDMLLDARKIPASPIGRTTKKEARSFCIDKKMKTDEERVLTRQELESLRKAVVKQIRKHPKYMPNYAILLATYTGMRVGELAALHWTDIRDGQIHIDFSEHRDDYADHSELTIGEPKNGKHRTFPLTSDIEELLKQMKDLGIDSEWVFARATGERFTAHDISCACDRRAKEAGLDGSSIHEIRRTVSSILRTVTSREAVAAMLGHLPETNDKHYDYDVTERSDKIIAL